MAGGFDFALNPPEFDLVVARAADATFVGNKFADHAVSFGQQIDVAGLILAESQVDSAGGVHELGKGRLLALVE